MNIYNYISNVMDRMVSNEPNAQQTPKVSTGWAPLGPRGPRGPNGVEVYPLVNIQKAMENG